MSSEAHAATTSHGGGQGVYDYKEAHDDYGVVGRATALCWRCSARLLDRSDYRGPFMPWLLRRLTWLPSQQDLAAKLTHRAASSLARWITNKFYHE